MLLGTFWNTWVYLQSYPVSPVGLGMANVRHLVLSAAPYMLRLLLYNTCLILVLGACTRAENILH